jgi:hypothetical protein
MANVKNHLSRASSRNTKLLPFAGEHVKVSGTEYVRSDSHEIVIASIAVDNHDLRLTLECCDRHSLDDWRANRPDLKSQLLRTGQCAHRRVLGGLSAIVPGLSANRKLPRRRPRR